MVDAKKEARREVCRRKYHRFIELGCFMAARKMLRDALTWRSPAARSQSKEWAYILRNGKIDAFVYNCSY